MGVLSDDRRGRRALVALSMSGLLVLALVGVRADATAEERFGRRRHMLALTNQDRETRDRTELGFATRLSRYARQHSEAMARKGYIFHSDADQIRGALDGHGWSLAGENVGVGGSLEGLEDAFMGSKPHRQNILRSMFRHAAVGIVRDGGHYWVTVIFYG